MDERIEELAHELRTAVNELREEIAALRAEVSGCKAMWVDPGGCVWTRGDTPGVLWCAIGPWNTNIADHASNPTYREACANLWPDFKLPE